MFDWVCHRVLQVFLGYLPLCPLGWGWGVFPQARGAQLICHCSQVFEQGCSEVQLCYVFKRACSKVSYHCCCFPRWILTQSHGSVSVLRYHVFWPGPTCKRDQLPPATSLWWQVWRTWNPASCSVTGEKRGLTGTRSSGQPLFAFIFLSFPPPGVGGAVVIVVGVLGVLVAAAVALLLLFFFFFLVVFFYYCCSSSSSAAVCYIAQRFA